jgi:hypothetical protein
MLAVKSSYSYTHPPLMFLCEDFEFMVEMMCALLYASMHLCATRPVLPRPAEPGWKAGFVEWSDAKWPHMGKITCSDCIVACINVEYKTGILDQYYIRSMTVNPYSDNILVSQLPCWSVIQCAERTILFIRPRVNKLISVVHSVQILSYNLYIMSTRIGVPS